MTSIFGILGVGIALSSLLVLIEKGIVANKLRNRLKALTTALPDNLPSLQIPLP